MSAPFTMTQDFRQEVEVHTLGLLRRRFLWFLGTVAGIYGTILVMTVLVLVALSISVRRDILAGQVENLRGGYWGLVACLALTSLDVGVFVWFARGAAARRGNRDRLLRLTQQFLMYRGAIDLVIALITRTDGFPWTIGMYHTIGCALLPWTPLQALRPMLFLLPLNAVIIMVSERANLGWGVMLVLVSCLLAAPGMIVAWVKTGRRSSELRMRVMQDRYGQMRRELVDARRLHEALFPRSFHDAELRFSYKYEPMRQIGGDYLYARFCPDMPGDPRPPSFDLLLIDVTGHGIAAALTVNRLYGEVERLFAEDPFASPADVLTALNRYVHLTLARYSIFATALCIRVDPANDRIEYASGGHPPAFLCAADGRIMDMDSTACVLGAIPPGEYDAAMRELAFMPGDALVAYTDGAIEARNAEGRMLGVMGFQQTLARCLDKGSRQRANGGAGAGGHHVELAASILRAVEEHRHGPPEDDTLVVELVRMVGGSRRADAISTAGGPLGVELGVDGKAALPAQRVDAGAGARTIRA